MTNVVFRLNAGAECGFGHASRCLRLAALLRYRGLNSAFEGRFSDQALASIHALDPDIQVRQLGETHKCDVAIIDLMVDPFDPDVVDPQELARWNVIADRTVILHSGLHAPTVPDAFLVIGYQPSGQKPAPPSLLWGLEYAPVNLSYEARNLQPQEERRCLVALGGALNWSAHERILGILNSDKQFDIVDLLVSPTAIGKPRLQRYTNIIIEMHKNVASVAELLSRSSCIIASFGNLCYEALALGRPLVVVGQKDFQRECGDLFESAGLAVSAGLADESINKRLPAAIQRLRCNQSLATRVDFDGLTRIADIIVEHSTHV